MNPRSIDDFAVQARRRLPRFLSEYIEGGSYQEQTLARNVADLRAIELRQRVLRNVESVDLTTRLFGREWALPIGLGPVGISGMFARRGEVQAARAAERANIPFCLSTMAVCGIDEVNVALRGPFWFQLYMIRDRGFLADLLDRTRAAGCSLLVLTVDMPVPSTRYRDFRSGFSGGSELSRLIRQAVQGLCAPRWLYNVGLRGRPHTLGNLRSVLGNRSGLKDCVGWIAQNFDPSVSWRDLQWIRNRWPGPLIIKGVLDVDDARECAALGADGIVVSNHGGRQFDGVRSTARVLPEIAEAVRDKLTVLADGGVRSGVDVMRMLALGAHAVLLGRAWAYALAAGGTDGVQSMINTLRSELASGMAMAGCTRLAQLDRSVLDPPERGPH